MNNIIREDNITPKTTLVLQPMPEQLLTVKDVSSLLKCNVATVHNLRKTGLLQFLKLGSYKCRVSTFLAVLDEYDGKDLDSLVQERMAEHESES